MKTIIELPDGLREQLEKKAEELGTSMSYIIKDSLYRYLKENE